MSITMPNSRRSVAAFGARVLSLAAGLLLGTSSSVAAQGFCEQDGLIVFQVEAVAPATGWLSETNSTGYTGSAFFRWNGGDQFNNPGQGVLTYTFTVTNPGTYNLRIRSRNNGPLTTENNDVFTRLDNGSWIKTFSKTNGTWTWSTWFEVHEDPSFEAFYTLSAGTHTFQISGRSQDFRIDRVHLYLASASDPLNINKPQSPEGNCATGEWTDVGHALAGTFGTPTLVGAGDQTDGANTTLSIGNGPPNGSAILIIGASAINAPFKFGVLVPSLDLLLAGLPLDNNGELDIAFAWPAGLPSNSSISWQSWLPAAGGPAGYAATNAVQSTTP